MDFELTTQRLSQIANTLDQMSWQTLAKHSHDDLEADSIDIHYIASMANRVANDIDFYLTHPSTRKAE
jgi:hypothetical protein